MMRNLFCKDKRFHKTCDRQKWVLWSTLFFQFFFITARWQHFFATKDGWGRYPWGYLQNPKTSRRVGHPSLVTDTNILDICLANSSQTYEESIFPFHSYYTVNAPNSDAPSSGQALISEQFLGDQFFYLVKSSQ